MKSIALTQDKIAVVDDADFEWLNHFKWYAYKNRNTFYAARQVTVSPGKQIMVKMHSEILNGVDRIDHINGNGLDNRRENLRAATVQQNALNRRLAQNNQSGTTGVYWHKQDQRWIAQIELNDRHVHVGSFTNQAEAIAARKGAKVIADLMIEQLAAERENTKLAAESCALVAGRCAELEELLAAAVEALERIHSYRASSIILPNDRTRMVTIAEHALAKVKVGKL
jgi:hypothetical protein